MSEVETVNGTAEEISTEIQPVRPPSANVALFGTNDPVQVVTEATKIADALAAVIQAKNLYTNISGRSHIKVEGWQLLGSMLGVTAVCTDTTPVEGGFRATVEARTVDGRVVGRADALCTKVESKWASADDYARLSMAQTRATSKALKGPLGFVVSLAGYQTTPAEEMPGTDGQGTETPTKAQAKRRDGQGDGKSAQMTAAQRRKVNGRAGELGLTEAQLLAWVEWNTGERHPDRVTKARASELIERLEGYEDTDAALAEFNAALEAGDERAEKIATKHSDGAGS